MKKALIITAVGGFLAQFETSDVEILQGLGYEVHYASNFQNPIYPSREDDLVHAGICLHQIDIEKSPWKVMENGRAFMQIRDIIKSEHIDLVHCHNPVGAAVARCAVQSMGHKPFLIYTAHGFHFYEGAPLKNWALYYAAEALLARCTDMVITINEEDYIRAQNFHLKKGGTVGKIPGVGVDMDRFSPKMEMKSYVRRELGIPEGAFHIVTAAELNKNKNQGMVIDALARLGHKDIFYSICGRGDQKHVLKKQIEENNLAKQIFLLGYRTDMERILQSADCFIFPSFREGLGIAALEALSTGIPLIVADNRGTREYAKDGTNALVCLDQTVEEYSKAIQRLYKNRNFLRKLALGCRKSAEPFRIEMAARIMRKLYEEADRKIETRKGKRRSGN